MAIIQQAEFERFCRLCAEEQEVTVMLFSKEAEAMLLQNKLNKYLLIEVDEDDKLPQNICVRCCTKLQTVCDFIDTVHRSQKLLMDRSLLLDQIATTKKTIPYIKQEIKETQTIENNTGLEVNVDPELVLQSSHDPLDSIESDDDCEDVLYKGDQDKVTIKLIKKGDAKKKDIDNNIKLFSCNSCKRCFNTELALKNHSWSHKPQNDSEQHYECATCNKTFDIKTELVLHLREHKRSGLCQLCGRVFRSEKTYSEHIIVHLSSKAYNCKICGRSYRTERLLKNHSISHSSERPFPCKFCKKSFKRNQDLKFHINQHTGNKPYRCPYCDKCFASSGNCYSHKVRIHPERIGEVISMKRLSRNAREKKLLASKTPLKLVKNIFKYQCQMCDHSFFKRDNLTYHMYQHTGEKPFHCTFCTEKFVTRSGLSLHHRTAHPSKDRPLMLLSKNVLLK